MALILVWVFFLSVNLSKGSLVVTGLLLDEDFGAKTSFESDWGLIAGEQRELCVCCGYVGASEDNQCLGRKRREGEIKRLGIAEGLLACLCRIINRREEKRER
jgi:hypothetical protein